MGGERFDEPRTVMKRHLAQVGTADVSRMIEHRLHIKGAIACTTQSITRYSVLKVARAFIGADPLTSCVAFNVDKTHLISPHERRATLTKQCVEYARHFVIFAVPAIIGATAQFCSLRAGADCLILS